MLFKFKKYEEECWTKTKASLEHEYHKYTRMLSSGAVGTTFSGTAFVATLGASGISLAFSAGAIHNARKKLEIIRRTMRSRFNEDPETRFRDVMAGGTFAAAVNTITMGMGDVGISQLMHEAASEGWVHILSHPGTVDSVAEVGMLAAGSKIEDKHIDHWENKILQQQAQNRWK